MLFFISLFSQLISADSSNNYALAYGLYIAILHGLWFSLVSIMFTSKSFQNKLIHMKKWINKACGVGLVSFGIILAAKS